MEILREQHITEKENFTEFDLTQVIGKLDIGESVTLTYIDSEGVKQERTFTAKYIDCHFNFSIQDMGIRTQ